VEEINRICFVCLGNIVRSPLAEHLFKSALEQEGLAEDYEVGSAGTGAWHVGESPDTRMRRVAAGRGLKYDGSARQFKPRDLDYYDLVIAMDRENRANLLSMARRPEHTKKIHLMREFDPQGGANAAVPDPYYGGAEGFERAYEIVERSVLGLLEAIKSGQV